MSEVKQMAIIGLGYVGLPLAVSFARHRPVIGFDINQARIAALQAGEDATKEVSSEALSAATHLTLTDDISDLQAASIFIVTVPTPVDASNHPDMTPLVKASQTVGQVLKKGDIVIYESTVYPGATEEVCVPELEKASGLTYNQDFFCGYSPERINPGDKTHRLETIVKVTSGSTPAIAKEVDALYQSIIEAGTHKASSIAVAEAAKVIENTQRDINIALMNELSLIFQRLDLDTAEVLAAAGTKWNFLPFRPGLVGGHCIGVDPYYLTHKAQSVGYHPEMILAGRALNDGMGAYVADETVKEMLRRGLPVKDAKILVLGLTFKEDCPDLRNSKVADVVDTLKTYGVEVHLHDAEADRQEAENLYGQPVLGSLEPQAERAYQAIILTVPHRIYCDMGAEALRALADENAVFYDVKSAFDKSESDLRL